VTARRPDFTRPALAHRRRRRNHAGMKILVLITPAPGATLAAMAPLLPDETRHVWAAYAAGGLREMYLMGGGRPGAVLVYEAADLESVRREAAGLPLVKSGLALADCIELAPFSSLERLFAAPTV